MGFFDTFMSIAGKAIDIIRCYTFSKNSQVHLTLGVQGPGTYSAPVYIAQDQQYITNLKLNFRLTGVSQLLDTLTYVAEQGAAGAALQTPDLSQSVQSVLFSNPTMRQSTIVSIALLKVKNEAGVMKNPLQPDMLIQWAQLQDTYLQGASYAPVTQEFDNRVIWTKTVQLNGPDTWCDILGGFANGEFPGPVFLEKNDFIQLVWSASNDFSNPQNGVAGAWARLAGNFSVEIVGSSESSVSDPQTQLNATDSIYKTLKTK